MDPVNRRSSSGWSITCVGAAMVLVLVAALAAGCGGRTGSDEAGPGGGGSASPEDPELLLATTTSTYDSGLLDVLVPAFEDSTGYEVKILSKGTGASLELGRNGDVDVLLVHAKERELALVEEGYFVDRRDVMYNDFVIVGPDSDPAGVRGMQSASAALEEIASSRATFASRGDDSGTHVKELALWRAAGVEPGGDWYLSVGQGMAATLRVAGEKGAYTIADRGTYISLEGELNLEVLVEGDPALFNQYGIMAVNPEVHPHVNYEGAKALIRFVTSEEGQGIIDGFRRSGEQLFFPNAGD